MLLNLEPHELKHWTLALAFAADAHGDQKRKYTGEPYWHHLAQVSATVSNTRERTSNMLQAALLHDVLEDTHVTATTLQNIFNAEVVWYVELLTEAPAGNGFGNRSARKAAYASRLSSAPRDVKTIKLADVLDNISSIVERDPDFAKVYMQEKLDLLPALQGGDPKLFALVKQQVESYWRMNVPSHG